VIMMPHLSRSYRNEVQTLAGLVHHNPQLIGSLQSVKTYKR